MSTTKTLVLSPTVSITINACTDKFTTPLGASPEERESIGAAYFAKSEFRQAMRALPADLSGLDLLPIDDLAITRGERLELSAAIRCWRPQFATLSTMCNAPTIDGNTLSNAFSMWQRMHTVRTLRDNAEAIEVIHRRAVKEMRKLGLDFDDLVAYNEYLGTFWLNESEEDIDAILRRSGAIMADDTASKSIGHSIEQAAREFYQGGQEL